MYNHLGTYGNRIEKKAKTWKLQQGSEHLMGERQESGFIRYRCSGQTFIDDGKNKSRVGKNIGTHFTHVRILTNVCQ